MRADFQLSPLKARIFDLVRRAGVGGISGDALFAVIYDGQLPRYRGGHAGRGEGRQRTTLKANIAQINVALADAGWRIRGSRCAGGWYWLERQEAAE